MSADPGGQGQPAPAAGTDPGAAPAAADPGQPGQPAQTAGDQDDGADARSYADAARQVAAKDIAGKDYEQKQHAEARARAEFLDSNIHGNVYVGSNFELAFGRGATQLKATRITAEELTEPFIRTTAIEQIASRISDQPLVVVQGQGGYGKAAALVRILRGPAVDAVPMFYLDPFTDLATFSCKDAPEGSVLILQDLPDDAAERLDEHAAKRIEGELVARRCRLGITAKRAAHLAARGTRFLVFDLDTRPAPSKVFDRHLTALLLGTGVTRTDVMSWPGVAELTDGELGPDCSLSDAKRLATLLAHARDEPVTAAHRVRVQMTEYADEQVAHWFRRLDSQKAHCMAISLAVLNGMSREVITREAEVLDRIISPAPGAPNAPPPVNVFRADGATSPALLNARVVTEVQHTDTGPIVVRAMRYEDRDYPGRVLRYVWRERDAGRAAIIAWLRQLGTSPDVVIRVRSAIAVGVLACEAMDFVYNHVIAAWARRGDPEARDSAALALGPPGEDRDLRKTVRHLVAEWAEERNWRLRATAARAYGRPLGLDSPSQALRELARLAGTDDVDVMIAVGSSYCELAMEGTTALSVRVLREIEGLAADRKRDRQVTGRLTLLGLSGMRGAPRDLSEHEERLAAWPTLLLLALANAEAAGSAARLWQLALHDPLVGEMVTDSLDGWAVLAEENAELRSSMVSFLRWVASDERSRRAVLRRAQVWADRTGEAPETGRSLIQALG